MKIPHHAFSVEFSSLVRSIDTTVLGKNSENSKELELSAVWDTGATNSAITQKVVDTLGLIPIDKTSVQTAGNQPIEVLVYLIDLKLDSDVIIENVRVSALPKIDEIDVLIGMDIICLGDFAITNYDKKTLFSFSVPPHSKKIDFVERANKLNKRNFKKKF